MAELLLPEQTSPPPSVSRGRDDFPEWLPPMVVKELRQGLRSQGFALILCLLHLFMLIVFLSAMSPDSLGKPLEVSTKVFWTFLATLLFGVTPVRGLQEIHAEKQTRTLELLSAAGVSGTRLVLGKWCSVLAQAGLMTLTLLPYFVLQYFGGAVDLIYQLRLMVLFILGSAFLTAVSVSVSGYKLFARLRWMAGLVGINLWMLIVILSGFFDNASFTNSINSLGWNWTLIVFGAALGTSVFLRLAGDVMDAPSANGALLPRLGVCLGWLVLVPAVLLGVEIGVQLAYLGLLFVLSGVAFYWQLQAHRPILKVHLKPFRKLGPFFGRIAAFFLLPTWVGTVLLAPVPFLGVAAYLESLSKTSTEKVFLGMCLHGAAFLLCLIVLWRLFFARKRDASGAIRERDPRFAFQWILGLSLFFSLGLKGQGGESFLRPVGIYLPVLFLWAYSSKDSSGVASADIHSYFLNTSLAFGFYFLLALVLGVVWLTRKSVWKNFWAESASSRIPGDGTEVAESEPNRSESKP